MVLFGPYARLVHLVNKYRISLKNCVFINMDEYMENENEYIDESDPLSFRGGMKRIFYSQIDDELNVLPENRLFPDPKNPGQVQEIIDKYGKLDMVFGVLVLTDTMHLTSHPSRVRNAPTRNSLNRATRVLKISRETKTINAFMNCGANLDAIPDYCITVGMKEIYQAKKIIMCMPRDWNAGALRKVLHGDITCHVPCSLFRNHPDATLLCCSSCYCLPCS